MSNNSEYHKREQDLHNLPLPDEDLAWQKMSALLDKEKPRRRAPFILWLNSYGGWIAMSLLAGALGWFLLQHDGAPEKLRSTGTATAGSAVTSPLNKQSSGNKILRNGNTRNVTQPGNLLTSKPSLTGSSEPASGSEAVADNLSAAPVKHAAIPVRTKRAGAVSGKKNVIANVTDINVTDINSAKSIKMGVEFHAVNEVAAPEKYRAVPLSLDHEFSMPQPTGGMPASLFAVADSLKQLSLQKKNGLYVSAGIGLQQQIPMGGQNGVPYGFYGRSFSLHDYIPSVYVRLHKGRWFLQGEFRYGAPQSVKELPYERDSKLDSTAEKAIITTSRLKKTFYHQIPFSLNYQVTRNWSVGAGGMYSLFYGAVSEKEIQTVNVLTKESTIKREITDIKAFNDSFLYNSQLQFILQTEYQWKRFSLGLRYTRDLQPFIMYTNPDGSVRSEKNETLQAILRFRIWKSR